MTFAFIGYKTDYYLSLHNHFIEENNQLLIYAPADALLNETAMDDFNALIIDYDSYTYSYILKLIQFLKIIHPNIPIVVLIGQNNSVKKTLLSLGAIDCLEKTMAMTEMMIRIYNVSEKAIRDRNLNIHIGENYVFDMHSSVLRYKKIVQPLTKKEIAFLQLLIGNGDKYTTIDDIARYVYADNTMIKDVAIRSVIMRLRKKLKEDIIETFPRFGYRLKPLSESILTQRGTYDKEI